VQTLKASRPTSAATDREPRGGLGGHQVNRTATPEQSNRQAGRSSSAIQAEIIGNSTCIAAGITVHAEAPVLALCRELVAAGYDPATRLDAWRGAVLALRVASIGFAAKLRTSTHGAGFEPLSARTGGPPVRRRSTGVGQQGLSGGAPQESPGAARSAPGRSTRSDRRSVGPRNFGSGGREPDRSDSSK